MNLSSIITAEDFERGIGEDSWLDAAVGICRRHNLSFEKLARPEYGENVVFLVDENFVIKIYKPFRLGFEREKAALLPARQRTSLPVPEILFEGVVENFKYLVTTQNKGVSLTRETWLKLEKKEQIDIIRRLARGLRELHAQSSPLDFDWPKFIRHQAATVLERQKKAGASIEWLEKIPLFLENNLPLLDLSGADAFLHGDVHFGNLRFTGTGGERRISGLFDFADSLTGAPEYDFVAVGVLMMQGQGDVQREFFRAYGYGESAIDAQLRRRLMLFTILYECSNLRKYALRLKPEAVDLSLEELERAIWCFAGEK
jgi:hygromycin-B 7''-O-kinase